jgi:HEPN domain-containing protein
MALPSAAAARPYYQAAKQRFEDARFLLDAGRTTGAIYLAGYCVEGMMKALILSMLPARKRAKILESFRGSKAHDYDWLRRQYFKCGGPQLPAMISKAFAFVNVWAVEIRYEARTSKPRDAEIFLGFVEEIKIWAEGRM